MVRPTANTRKVAAAKRKTEERKEESKEVSYDDEYLVLSGGYDKDQYEGETKEPSNEDGDPNFETSGSESENIEEAKPKNKMRETQSKKTIGNRP